MGLKADWKIQQDEYERKASAACLHTGTYVRITGKRNFMDNGWAVHWSDVFMTPLIGRVGRVVKCSGSAGYEVEFSGSDRTWNFPYEVLDVIFNKVKGEIEYGFTE